MNPYSSSEESQFFNYNNNTDAFLDCILIKTTSGGSSVRGGGPFPAQSQRSHDMRTNSISPHLLSQDTRREQFGDAANANVGMGGIEIDCDYPVLCRFFLIFVSEAEYDDKMLLIVLLLPFARVLFLFCVLSCPFIGSSCSSLISSLSSAKSVTLLW